MCLITKHSRNHSAWLSCDYHNTGHSSQLIALIVIYGAWSKLKQETREGLGGGPWEGRETGRGRRRLVLIAADLNNIINGQALGLWMHRLIPT